MLPLSDGLKARTFPFVNASLIVACFAVWIFYELPHLDSATSHASFYPCTVTGTCDGPQPWYLSAGSTADARVPNLGASGAIAAVLGAYFVFYPTSRILTLFLVWPVRVPAWYFLGAWFLFQLAEANFGLFAASDSGAGVAFFAHVGGFLVGLLVAVALTNSGRARPQDYASAVGAPA